jgi:hypothetical protein
MMKSPHDEAENSKQDTLLVGPEAILGDTGRWLPARLIWRWGSLLWIGPLLGLLTGLVLVFVFLKKNETVGMTTRVGDIPVNADAETFRADMRGELGSEATLMIIQRHLDQDGAILKTPLWWIRSRIHLNTREMSEQFNDDIGMFYTCHSYEERVNLSEAFQAAAKEVVPRVRARYVEGWLKQIDVRLGEIDKAYKVAEAKGKILYRNDIPFIDEREKLENDRLSLLYDDENLGRKGGLAASSGGPPPWWKSPPEWAIFVCRCAGYGLLAVFPAMLLLEKLWPRRPARKII